ncbi:MAG: hypothetical protein LUG14_09300 [Synergistaceae bacterium]|nr:hypothetical protein [Synergistaceae bacterium]
MDNRAGCYSIYPSNETAYHSFVHSPLPPTQPIKLADIGLFVKEIPQPAVLKNASVLIPEVGLSSSMYTREESLIPPQTGYTLAAFKGISDPPHDASDA